MLEQRLINQVREFGLNYANEFLSKKCLGNVEVHSISIIGGGARCYFDRNDSVEKHKDLDIDIYFYNKNNDYKNIVHKINTQGTPKVLRNTGFLPTMEDRIDIARIFIKNYDKYNFVENIIEHAKRHNNSKRWFGSDSKPGRLGSPMIFIYPEFVAVERL